LVLAAKPGALTFGELTGALGGDLNGGLLAEIACQHLLGFAIANRLEQGQIGAVALDQGLGFGD
jgi:hypothetical protein